MPNPAHPEPGGPCRLLHRGDLWLLVPLALLLALTLATMRSSGAYMDAVNPDYLALRLLEPTSGNVPYWLLRGNLLFRCFPVLINLYHGALPYYTGLPFYLLFGTGVEGIRLANAGLGALVLVLLYVFLRSFGVRRWLAIPALCLLVVDPAFFLSLRTQFYITLQPIGFALLSAALLARDDAPGRWRIAASGFFAGLSVYGYFIYGFVFVPLALFALLTLHRAGAPRRAWLLWPLGAAAGGIGYPLGLALAWMASADTTSFLQFLRSTIQGLSPDQSTLSLAERLRVTLGLARMAVDAQGNIAMLLGEALPVVGHPLRYIVLGLAAAGGLLAWLLARRGSRAILLILAFALGYLALGLTFGDRLWAHHFSALPVLFYALLALLLQAMAPGGPPVTWPSRLAPAVLVLLLPLAAANLRNFRMAADRLEQTGGVGLSSDAITRFGEDVGRMRPAPLMVAPDWGVFMPAAMTSRGTVRIVAEFTAGGIRRALCSGQDVVLGLVVSKGVERVPGWTRELAWSEPALVPYTQRDGRPMLISVHWRAAERPAEACAS